MIKTMIRPFPLLLSCVLLLTATSALAFKRDTRCQILKDAIYFCPSELKAYLMKNFKTVHEGIHFADRNKIPDRLISKDTQTFYANLTQMLRDNRMDEDFTSRGFGLLVCYIAETISPDHYITASALTPNKVTYYGVRKIKNIDDSVSMLIKKYRNPYRGNQELKVTNFLYIVAVNEIVNHWVAAWQAAGKNPGKLKPQGTILSRKLLPAIQFNSRFT